MHHQVPLRWTWSPDQLLPEGYQLTRVTKQDSPVEVPAGARTNYQLDPKAWRPRKRRRVVESESEEIEVCISDQTPTDPEESSPPHTAETKREKPSEPA
ncbi:MAG: hypothetical protein KVP17_005150 [Porospora cf. gigantea B]|uniref:uncharacterized protein n=1 Tax=Porospora cf. gigantea B TaxID=2853592 RepID=UPI003571D245|nr:MAG: hypothetical protein KVP17_005150 [Porospora cf. gigantea B]